MDTLTAARSRDPSVRKADVQDWLQRHRGRLTGGARAAAAPEPEAPEPEPSWTKDQIIEHYYEAYNNIGNVKKRGNRPEKWTRA